ncbi:MAG: 6-phosphogluconolactonase [Candidatus Pacebacteria bacterium]|nr:6-phosphogluconolactonase [Candidatus Paceibacterota bacterium]
MKIVFEKEEKILQKKIATALSEILVTKEPTLLLLASGSALLFLDLIDREALTSNLTVGMVDERYSEDPNINNFAQLKKTKFYATAEKRRVHFFDSQVKKDETLEQYGRRFAENIEDWLRENPKGHLIATFGMGEDGHTAGIFPYPENPEEFRSLFEKNPTATAYDAKNKNMYSLRVTTTYTFIKTKIDKALIYITGEKKRKALARVLSSSGTIEETPGRIWREMRDVKIFSDIKI